MIRLSANPTIDTVIKLVTVAMFMFAFVFVVMVPLYDVLCDALGINGKTSGQAYTAEQSGIDESRTVTIQFLASNNAGMPWEFAPTTTMMKVHPGAVNDTVFFARNTQSDANGCPGDTQHFACQGSRVFSQDGMLLLQAAAACRGGVSRAAAAVYCGP